MGYFSDLWSRIRGSVRNCLTTPLDKRKMLIIGGIVAFIVLFIIILVIALPGTSTATVTGSDVLDTYPAIIGNNTMIVTAYNANMTVDDLVTNTTYVTDYSDIISGRLGVIFWSLGYCPSEDSSDRFIELYDQFTYLNEFATLSNSTNATTYSTADSVLTAFESWSTTNFTNFIALSNTNMFNGSTGLFYLFKNALDFKIVSLADCNSTNTNKTTLSDFDTSLLTAAAATGVIVDLTGIPSSVQIAALNQSSTQPFVFTNANAYNITEHDNNIEDDVLTLIASSNAIIMVSLNCEQLSSNTTCTITDFMDHLDYLVDYVTKDKIGLGLGWGLGTESNQNFPTAYNTSATLPTLLDYLYTKGWTIDELEGLVWSNFEAIWT